MPPAPPVAGSIAAPFPVLSLLRCRWLRSLRSLRSLHFLRFLPYCSMLAHKSSGAFHGEQAVAIAKIVKLLVQRFVQQVFGQPPGAVDQAAVQGDAAIHAELRARGLAAPSAVRRTVYRASICTCSRRCVPVGAAAYMPAIAKCAMLHQRRYRGV
jgi:hypothetical protein